MWVSADVCLRCMSVTVMWSCLEKGMWELCELRNVLHTDYVMTFPVSVCVCVCVCFMTLQHNSFIIQNAGPNLNKGRDRFFLNRGV